MVDVNNINMIENYRTGKQLLNQAELNYQAAQNYYTQKKMFMLKMLCEKRELDIQEVENGLINSMNNLIQTQWQQINDTVLKNVKIGGGISGKYTIKENANWVNIPSDLVNLIKNKSDKNGNIFSMLGLYYEQWLKEQLNNAIVNTGNNAINEVLNNFLAGFTQTGALKTSSAMRQYADIRPDLATGIGAEAGADKILRDKNNNLSVELQTAFDIQSYREQNKLFTMEAIQNDENILREYIEGDMFGFSVKRWTSEKSEGRMLTSASGIQAIINHEYELAGNKTWNAIFAYRKMVFIISRYLLDILGPVNIAFITGTSFTWASDFLADALLTMNIYSKKIYANNEVKPYINSGNIYVQHYKRGRTAAMLATDFAKSNYMYGKNKKGDKTWEAFQLKFSINKKN